MKYSELYLRFPEFKTRALTFSFDDGTVNDRKMVEILNRYGIKCTFNMIAGRIDDDTNTCVQSEELSSLYQGHEIASHTYSHRHLENLDLGGIAYEIIKDREALETASGKIVQGFAYPYGLREKEGLVQCIGNCGIKYARTGGSTNKFDLPTDYMRWQPTCHQASPKMPELAEAFFAPEDTEHPWRIRLKHFLVFGHSFEYKSNWDKLEELCQLLSGRDEVWYVTCGELIDYISAFDALRRSVNGSIIHNPTDVDLYVRMRDKNIILPKGETTVIE